MGLRKNSITMEADENVESDSDSDVSMTSESDSSEKLSNESDTEMNEVQNDSTKQDEDSEEEDDLIKAIKQERDKRRDHPPNITCEDHIVDISFHPHENLLGVASITGDVLIYKYTNEENTLVDTHELHLKACRDIEFDSDGKILFSTAKDKAIMLTDVATGKLIRCYDNCHEVPIYCISVIDENVLASGKIIRLFLSILITHVAKTICPGVFKKICKYDNILRFI